MQKKIKSLGIFELDKNKMNLHINIFTILQFKVIKSNVLLATDSLELRNFEFSLSQEKIK